MMEKTQTVKNFSILRKILGVAGVVILSLFALANVYLTIKTIIKKDFEIFGYNVLYVNDNNCYPAISKGTLCLYNTKYETINVGEMVVFVDDNNIYYIQKVEAVSGEAGNLQLVTHDNISHNTIVQTQVLGVYVKNLNNLKGFASFCDSILGYIILIGLPITALITILLIAKKFDTNTDEEKPKKLKKAKQPRNVEKIVKEIGEIKENKLTNFIVVRGSLTKINKKKKYNSKK